MRSWERIGGASRSATLLCVLKKREECTRIYGSLRHAIQNLNKPYVVINERKKQQNENWLPHKQNNKNTLDNMTEQMLFEIFLLIYFFLAT